MTGKLFQACIKISNNTEVARKQFLSLTFLMVGFAAVCAQGFAFLYCWSVPVSKLSFSLLHWDQWLESQTGTTSIAGAQLWGCCRAVTAALLAHITQGTHLLIDRLGNHGTARWKGRRFYSKLSFKIQTGAWIDWREQAASGSQPVTLAVKRALGKATCETAQVMHVYLTSHVHFQLLRIMDSLWNHRIHSKGELSCASGALGPAPQLPRPVAWS